MIDSAVRDTLVPVLEDARNLGFVGPGPVNDHIEHSLAFVAAWSSLRTGAPDELVDIGSGAGVPGLVLALAWPACCVVLLDGSERRVAFLVAAIGRLRLAGRVTARAQRAEEAGRSDLRASASFVTARGFAAPAVTAECGGALVTPGGLLAVSEPPGGDPSRWPDQPLAVLGLETAGLVTEPAAVQVLVLTGSFPDRYPRRVGIPSKRPLWS